MMLVQPEWMGASGPRPWPGAWFLLSLGLHAAMLLLVLDHRTGTDPAADGALAVQVALAVPGRSPAATAPTAAPDRPPEPTPPEPLPEPTPEPRPAPLTTREAQASVAPVDRSSAGPRLPGPATAARDLIGADESRDAWREIADFGDVPLPVFPPPILSWGEAVVLVMRLHVLPDGRVQRVDIVRSSGFPSLDDAAIEAAMARRYAAADHRELERRVVFHEGEDS